MILKKIWKKFFNRLFNVLGIINNIYNTEDELPNEYEVASSDKEMYYVSDKYINYNKKYEELLRIMYKFDFYRWEEMRCECDEWSLYEVEIYYTMDDYFQTLRKDWELSKKTEKLEDRNWRLLKKLEECMDSDSYQVYKNK